MRERQHNHAGVFLRAVRGRDVAHVGNAAAVSGFADRTAARRLMRAAELAMP
jgi:hypothetical protein